MKDLKYHNCLSFSGAGWLCPALAGGGSCHNWSLAILACAFAIKLTEITYSNACANCSGS